MGEGGRRLSSMKTIIELNPETFVSAAHIAYVEPVDATNCIVYLMGGKSFQIPESATEVARTINNQAAR